MTRLMLGVLVILGVAACEPYDAQEQAAPESVTTDQPTSSVRISGYGRVGVSGRL